MAPLSEPARGDFREIREDRYEARSTILTSQLPVSRWRFHSQEPRKGEYIGGCQGLPVGATRFDTVNLRWIDRMDTKVSRWSF
jgi:hypothetical protein